MNTQDKIQAHKDICVKMNDTYIRKNKDYGNAFVKVRAKFPNAILIRLNDKLNRLESLYESGEQFVVDETLDDTLLDLANYCVMELVERKTDANEKKSGELPKGVRE